MGEKIKSFTDLIVWRKAHVFVLNIYKVSNTFPTGEKFGLTNQIRRASVSITSNIAEGFCRRTALNKNQFYYDSLASLAEVQNQLLIARDLKYMDNISFHQLSNDSIEVQKLLYAFLKSSRTKESM